MKILLDCSAAKIREYRELYQEDFGQLRTPGTNYALTDDPEVEWAADNYFYTDQDVEAWRRFVSRFDENRSRRPLFVSLPDIVGNARRTRELFDVFRLETNELPRALVIQNGIGHVPVPWKDIQAIFVGGDDDFKTSREAIDVVKVAYALKKHIHVGRVNTAKRVRNLMDSYRNGRGELMVQTIDGSGISRFDHMLEDVLFQIRGEHPQQALIA